MVEQYADEFGGSPVYEYCRHLCYRESDDPAHTEKAFISGKRAIEGIKGNGRLYAQVVPAGIGLVSQAELTPIEYNGTQLDRDETLSECAEYGKNATLLAPEGSAWYRRYAECLNFKNDLMK